MPLRVQAFKSRNLLVKSKVWANPRDIGGVRDRRPIMSLSLKKALCGVSGRSGNRSVRWRRGTRQEFRFFQVFESLDDFRYKIGDNAGSVRVK